MKAIAFVSIGVSVVKAAVFKNSGLPLSIEEIEDPVPSPTDMFKRFAHVVFAVLICIGQKLIMRSQVFLISILVL